MPAVLVLYQYFQPDDVVSAIHFADLCEGLHNRGWDVTVLPCNRGCRDESASYPIRETWRGVKIHRVWRPGFRQSSNLGRLANIVWMICAWTFAAVRYRPDVLIVGTDPIGSVLTAIPWKILRPSVKIAHWCFDVYPEVAIADGVLKEQSRTSASVRRLVRAAYAMCDVLVDIGPCMRTMLGRYGLKVRAKTLPPWALLEPAHPLKANEAERKQLFGEAHLTILYSGNFGRAHAFDRTLALARRLRSVGAQFVFSIRGNAVSKLQASITSADTNVSIVPFVAQEHLEAHLGSADIHAVTLRDNWTGAVVPSKFFGAIAAGRPVLFEGSPECAIAQWIREFGVGWILTPESMEAVAMEFRELAKNRGVLATLFQRCHEVYSANFSREAMIDCWNRELRTLCPESRSDMGTDSYEPRVVTVPSRGSGSTVAMDDCGEGHLPAPASLSPSRQPYLPPLL